MIDMDKGGELYELHRDFPRSAEKKWKSQLVICHNEADQLPISSLDGMKFYCLTIAFWRAIVMLMPNKQRMFSIFAQS